MAKVSPAAMIPLLLFAGLAVALLVGLWRDNPDDLPTVFIDKPAPELPSEPLSNLPPAGMDDLNAPDLKLVNFWASWCPPCRAEHPHLMTLKSEGWSIIGVNKSDTEQNALGFLEELGNPYSGINADPSGRGSIEWGVYGLPETFLIDQDGRIRYRHPGPVTQRVWEDRFAPIIAAIKSESELGKN